MQKTKFSQSIVEQVKELQEQGGVGPFSSSLAPFHMAAAVF